jgi:hypothetical protein
MSDRRISGAGFPPNSAFPQYVMFMPEPNPDLIPPVSVRLAWHDTDAMARSAVVMAAMRRHSQAARGSLLIESIPDDGC